VTSLSHSMAQPARARRWLRCTLVVLLLPAAPLSAIAQAYPAKPVRVIVPFAPGGGVDYMARLMGQRLAEPLGQQMIVDNRPGAGGTVGTEIGVKAPADGYTLTMVSSSYPVLPSLYKLTFDPLADIAPIILVAKTPFIVTAHPSLPVRTIKQLIALAKAKPGEINFGSAGTGSGVHLATELFMHQAGGPDGYLVATGHGGDGMALAPITGLYLAEAIARDGKDCDLTEFLGSFGRVEAGAPA